MVTPRFAHSKDGVTIHFGATPLVEVARDYHLVGLAKDALSGRLAFPNPDDPTGPPIEVVDHKWLLQLAALACTEAASRMDG